MRKLIAVVLALVLALSCTAIAFAADSENSWNCPYCKQTFNNLTDAEKTEHKNFCRSTTTGGATNTQKEYVCPGCGKVYYDYREYNECLQSHNYGVDSHYWSYIGQTIPQIIDTLRNYFVGSQTQTLIFDILYKILDYVTGFIDARIGGGTGDIEGVNGAVAELDGALAGIDLSLPQFEGVTELVTSLKQKIKDLYTGSIETTIVVETEAEAPAETGSANPGIAVFAAISVAAAAAFICTRKKAE